MIDDGFCRGGELKSTRRTTIFQDLLCDTPLLVFALGPFEPFVLYLQFVSF